MTPIDATYVLQAKWHKQAIHRARCVRRGCTKMIQVLVCASLVPKENGATAVEPLATLLVPNVCLVFTQVQRVLPVSTVAMLALLAKLVRPLVQLVERFAKSAMQVSRRLQVLLIVNRV